MPEFFSLQEIDEAAQSIRQRLKAQPSVGLVLGSGLGGLADQVQNAVYIEYATIPHWPVSTVPGHAGRLVIGELAGKIVLVQQGRAHFYEGYSMAEVTLPVRVMRRLGIETVILTNAAGAIHPEFEPGDVMLITDHLSLIGMTGFNPLRGPNLEELGPRFPDMSQVYDRELMQLTREEAQKAGIALREGVYVGLSGPSFETPADLRFLRLIGADAVGMSTVPEAIVAKHSGMRVLAFSGISNKANLDGNTITTHEEVLESGKQIVPKLETLITRVLQRLSSR